MMYYAQAHPLPNEDQAGGMAVAQVCFAVALANALAPGRNITISDVNIIAQELISYLGCFQRSGVFLYPDYQLDILHVRNADSRLLLTVTPIAP